MEQKEILGLKIITNFETYAKFHSIASQKLGKFLKVRNFVRTKNQIN